MPAGAVSFSTWASTTIGGTAENTFYEFGVPIGQLAAGQNVLAVEIHQANPTSSDISFDLELIASDVAVSIIRGPYLQRGAPRAAIVRWRTNALATSAVWLGASPGSLALAYQSAVQETEHVAVLQGLSPDTLYYYAIGDSSGPLAGGDPEHRFRTHPLPGTTGHRRIWAIGDSGTADANARRVRDAYTGLADRSDTDVWLMLGDNAYVIGTDAEFQAAVFDTYPDILRSTFVWPTFGNHDAGSASAASQTGPYFDAFSLPQNAESGGVPSGTEAYYSFDYGDVHFVCLDSQDSTRTSTGAMAAWLRADLAASTGARWLIAYWHHPPYTKGSHDSDNVADSGGRMRDMREVFVPILEAHGVDLVLTGHSHSYERSFLLDGHYDVSSTLIGSMVLDGGDGAPLGDGSYGKGTLGPGSHEGAVYVVAGSSGLISGGALNHPAMRVGLNRLGSLVLDLDGDTLDARFLDDLGQVLDRFQIVKGPQQTLARDLAAISVSRGGRQDWRLDLGAARAGNVYIVAGTVSGTSPGYGVLGVHVPLNQDPWWSATLSAANSSWLPSSFGTLDPNGRASSALVFPALALPSLVGLHLHHAALVVDGLVPVTATNPVAVTLTP
ncbi:MAG: metallophosphoesterase family protein [Planctomycetes bacterium]|nr:metallophosphoesterase family protein [Planctomycetota bacterium]